MRQSLVLDPLPSEGKQKESAKQKENKKDNKGTLAGTRLENSSGCKNSYREGRNRILVCGN